MKKRIVCFVFAVVLMTAAIGETASAVSLPFDDVSPSDWFYSYVEYAYEQEIMAGTGLNKFSPEGTTTRAMVVVVLYKMDEAAPVGDGGFKDVPKGAWYKEAVDWAFANGIVSGVGGGLFAPDTNVTREQFAVMLMNYVKYKEGDPSSRANLNRFSDRKSVSDYAVPAMKWAVSAGIVTGRSGTEISPRGSATRAELATMIYKLSECVLPSEEMMHPDSTEVPIIMFHSITDTYDPANGSAVTDEQFAADIQALKDAGYNTVFYRDLVEYVDNGTPLPENPIIITLDDGYANNLTYAYPILSENGYCAEISVIGCYVGLSSYFEREIIPHFSFEDVTALDNWQNVLSIDCHTYKMHMLSTGSDLSLGRQGVVRGNGESEEAYLTALREDFTMSRDMIVSYFETEPVMTYPYGLYTPEAEQVSKELGFRVTATTEMGTNVITAGQPDCLYLLNRLDISSAMRPQDVLDKIEANRTR